MQQSSEASVAPTRNPGREAVHDLRNLFAVVGSIRHLLSRHPDGAERVDLLRALAEVASRGEQLTSRLLSNAPRHEPGLLDVGAQVAEAAPMLQAIARPSALLEIDTQVAMPAALVEADSADLEAIMLELIANATASGARRIKLRCRRIGDRVWLVIADDGPGLLQKNIATWRRASRKSGHGVGLGRVRRAVLDMGGKLLIRSSVGAGVGTVIAMLLPVTHEVVGEPRAREWRISPPRKESCDEDRWTVAA